MAANQWTGCKVVGGKGEEEIPRTGEARRCRSQPLTQEHVQVAFILWVLGTVVMRVK
jgi:hypothetical protein